VGPKKPFLEGPHVKGHFMIMYPTPLGQWTRPVVALAGRNQYNATGYDTIRYEMLF